MLQAVVDQIEMLLGLGLDVGDVDPAQMALRTVIIYVFTLSIVRLGSKRYLAESTAFDIIVSIMIGSIMSRAINGSAPFVPTLVSGVILLGLHWLFAFLSSKIQWFGPIIKGNPILLIKDGQLQERGMRSAGLSRHDLEQFLRMEAQNSDPSTIERAYLERSGNISVLPYEKDPSVLILPVESGVQTVRIEIK